jgi:lipoyl(octanoyl) transferase
MQPILFRDLGIIDYKRAWDYQEQLLQRNIQAKANERDVDPQFRTTEHYFLICEHNPVYTLGKSGSMSNVLLTEEELHAKHIQFYKTNRGGDITFHGPQQIVGYPILDLEKYSTDIGKYLRKLEQVVINTLAEYGLNGMRSPGETGVWLDADIPGRERKICALGVRCSRWVTMHGFALNVNTDLDYFDNIVPCGISGKAVTSIKQEFGAAVDYDNAKYILKQKFEEIFDGEFHDA